MTWPEAYRARVAVETPGESEEFRSGAEVLTGLVVFAAVTFASLPETWPVFHDWFVNLTADTPVDRRVVVGVQHLNREVAVEIAHALAVAGKEGAKMHRDG